MNRAEFAGAIDEAIVKATKNQTNDMRFVTTLRDYIMGLILVQPLERSKLKAMLREFIPEGLSTFVDWLLKFVQEVGLPDTEKPKPDKGSTKSRVRSTVMLAGQQLGDDKVDERGGHTGGHTGGTAGRASREPAQRDAASHERQKERSRSPVGRIPITKRVARAGQHALFTDAIRRVEGSAPELLQKSQVAIKREPESPDVIVMDASNQGIKQEAATLDRAIRTNPNGAHTHALGSNAPTAKLQHDAAVGTALDEVQPAHAPEDYDSTSVVITNVHFEATPEQVGLYFHNRCGGVMRVTILKNAHGMPKGYAYMQLASPLATQAALSLDGAEFMGRTVKVLPKLRKPPAPTIPHWLLTSMSSMMPFVWSGARHGSMFGSHTRFPGQGLVTRHPHKRYTQHSRVGMAPAGAWIRGISDPLHYDRDA